MMKKRILTIVAALMMAISPAMAQIFVTEEDTWDNPRVQADDPNLGVMVPLENVEYDQYVPVGEGLALLAGLGFAYMIGNRRKKE